MPTGPMFVQCGDLLGRGQGGHPGRCCRRVVEGVRRCLGRRNFLLRCIGRVVWRRGVWLTRRLLDWCPESVTRIGFENGLPVLRDPVSFADELEAARRAALKVEKEVADRSARRGSGRRQALVRMSAVWARAGEPEVVVGERQASSEIAARLHAHWAPRAPAGGGGGGRVLVCCSWASVALCGAGPSWADIAGSAGRARAIRRQALTDCGSPHGVIGLMWAVMDCVALLVASVATLLVFLPKSVEQGEGEEVLREAGVLRPLGLQNADAKLIQHTLDGPLTRHVAQHAHASQRGFVHGRNVLGTVLDVDREASIQWFRGDARRLPILISYDFVAAFPRAAHLCLQRAMSEADMPRGFIGFDAELCRMATLHLSQEGGATVFSRIAPGVLKDNTPRGSMFVLVMDTLLEALSQAALDAEGLVRAYVGDVAPVLGRMSLVSASAPIFRDIEAASGLPLHGRKGVVVPLLDGASDRVQCRVARELRRLAPEWGECRIDRCALPRVLHRAGRWRGPVGGRRLRVAAGSVAMQIQAIVAAYRPCALPMMLYVAQLARAARRLEEVERVELGRMWRMPANLLSQRMQLDVAALGGPRMGSVAGACPAAMARKALRTGGRARSCD